MRFEARRLTCVVVLVAIVSVGAAWGYAQSLGVQRVTPTVLSGPDLGFRVEGQRGGTPVGTLVVRIDGQWVEAEFGSGIRQLTAK